MAPHRVYNAVHWQVATCNRNWQDRVVYWKMAGPYVVVNIWEIALEMSIYAYNIGNCEMATFVFKYIFKIACEMATLAGYLLVYMLPRILLPIYWKLTSGKPAAWKIVDAESITRSGNKWVRRHSWNKKSYPQT